MAGRVAGKVAFITGAARGQGRAHAVRLAEEGADIIAIDICRDYGDVPYPLATEADLAETVKAVEALDRRIVATVADVRDAGGLKAAVDDGWPSSAGWTSSAPTRASAPSRAGTR
jgi:NAD(P)-dependent dehydrogenase (short-subunit alcohol dehydrogenase family)